MRNLTLKGLSEEEVQEVHLTSLEVLEKVGVSIRLDEARHVLKQAGAILENGSSIIRIPPQMVKDALRKCSPFVELYGRGGTPVMRVGGERVYFGTEGFPVNLLDWRTNEHRDVTTKDQIEMVKLADVLGNIDFLASVCCPTDVPPAKMDRYTWKNSLMNTRKHVQGESYGKQGVRDAIGIASILAGGIDELRKKPFISFNVTNKSPLGPAPENSEVIIEVAKQGMPLYLTSGPMCGATAPATLASTLVMGNCELLVGLILAKLVNPLVPIIYASWARIFDMKFANIASASPEFCLLKIGATQLAQFYGLPSGGGGFMSDSEVPDAQAGYEKVMSGLATALRRTNMIEGMGLLEGGGIASAEALVLDNEIAGYIRRFTEGISFEEDRIDMELFKKVGAGDGRNFLGEDHTLKYYRKEMWLAELSNRYSLSNWLEQGAKDIRMRAKELIQEKLYHFIPLDLPENFEEKANKIIEG
jgi:trimethylamine---corrinoid protein Co-methyltransferase